ncbi:hypothetical protein VNO77_26941 [Canavalia gladiata]|uniref:Uncharacterized protein n=1 Tax=Canavalia gladiata TaxID=3824 RepID=A0AAN9KW11_CANGL
MTMRSTSRGFHYELSIGVHHCLQAYCYAILGERRKLMKEVFSERSYRDVGISLHISKAQLLGIREEYEPVKSRQNHSSLFAMVPLSKIQGRKKNPFCYDPIIQDPGMLVCEVQELPFGGIS